MKAFFGLVGCLSLLIFLVGYGLRLKALTQRYQSLQHPLAQNVSKEPLTIAYQAGSLEAPANTWAAVDRLLPKSDELIVWLDLHQTKDDVFVLYGANYLRDFTNAEGHLWTKTWQDLEDIDAGYRFALPAESGTSSKEFPFRGRGVKIRRLDDTLKRYPQMRFVLNNLSNKKDSDTTLAEIIDEDGAGSRVIMASPFDVILRSSRTHHALYMYTSGPAELTRLMMLDSVSMNPVAPIKGDILVSPDRRVTRGFTPSVIEEVHRRQKLIVSGLLETPEERQEALQMGFDGVLTAKPLQMLSQ